MWDNGCLVEVMWGFVLCVGVIGLVVIKWVMWEVRVSVCVSVELCADVRLLCKGRQRSER